MSYSVYGAHVAVFVCVHAAFLYTMLAFSNSAIVARWTSLHAQIDWLCMQVAMPTWLVRMQQLAPAYHVWTLMTLF